MSKKVIDVSAYQGEIDWKKVKAAGVDGAALKIIRKDLHPDKQFEANWNGCKTAGVEICGVYNYSYATTVDKAKQDAKKVLEIQAGRKAKIWLDVENACQKGLGKNLIEIINAYGDVIRVAGYEFGVYTGLSFYNSYIRPWAGYLKYTFWIARYPSTRTMTIAQEPSVLKQPAISHTLEGWQYSSAGSVPGINGKVDLNIWYGKIPSEKPYGTSYPIPTRVIYFPKFPPKMTGEDVKWVQHHLIRLGFLTVRNSKGKSNIDGIFGKDSEKAVKQAQEHYGIKVDGIVGADTRRAIQFN